MQIIIVSGRAVAKPELKTYGDKQYAAFSVASDTGYGDKKTTQYYDCTVWNKTADNCCKLIDKGTEVRFYGTPKSRGYVGKDGQAKSSISVNVTEWECSFSKKDGQVDDGFKDVNLTDIPF